MKQRVAQHLDNAETREQTYDVQRDAHRPQFPPAQGPSLVPIVSQLEIGRPAHPLGLKSTPFLGVLIDVHVHPDIALCVMPTRGPIFHPFCTRNFGVPERSPRCEHEAIHDVAPVREHDRVQFCSPGFLAGHDGQIGGTERWMGEDALQKDGQI